MFPPLNMFLNQGARGQAPQTTTTAEDAVENNNEALERVRRAQVIRVGLMLTLFLTMFDTNNNRSAAMSKRAEPPKAAKSAGTERINSIINENSRKLQQPDAFSFPKNVTGLYRGTWQKQGPDSFLLLPADGKNTTSWGVKIVSTLAGSSLVSPPSQGKLLMQLKSLPWENIPDLTYVYGVIRLSGASQRTGDLLYPVQGVFLSTTGQLTMLTSPYSTQKLFLRAPMDNTSTSTIPKRRRRKLFAEEQVPDSPSASTSTSTSLVAKVTGGALTFLQNVRLGLQRRILHDEILAMLPGNFLLGQSDGLDPSSSVRAHRRRLAAEETGGSRTVHVAYGILLTLADTASAAHLDKPDGKSGNSSSSTTTTTTSPSSSYYVEGVGGGLLPATFKSLQQSVLHSVPSGSCQIGVKFKAASLVPNKNDKDIPLLPDVGPNSARLTPQVTNGETFSSSLNGAMDGQNCLNGQHSAGFNMSAQSYHLQVNVVEKKAMSYAVLATAICFAQIGFLVVQLRHAQNPAGTNKMSILGMCSQALIDALICIGHLLLCAAIPGVFFQHLLWVALLKLVAFTVFEMRAVVSIYHARFGQEAAGLDGWVGVRRRLATLHFRFYGALFLAMFATITLRNMPVVIVLLLYSCWLPQIVYNAVAGTRRALHPVYLYGTAVTRLFIPLYVFGCPSNFLTLLLVEAAAFPFSPAACFVLVIWTCLQVGFLTAQDAWGPRFFIPKQFLPQRYDYNRPVPQHLLLRGSSSSEGAASGESGDVEMTQMSGEEDNLECVICYNELVLTRGLYSISPCDHLFHKECLARWMQVKLECPTCRAPLQEEEE